MIAVLLCSQQKGSQPCFRSRKNALCAITITQPFCGGLPTGPRPKRPALDCVLSPTKSTSLRRASAALGSLPDFRASGLPDFAGEFIGGPNSGFLAWPQHRQRGPKVYSLQAPEVECIGKGKARAPYEFGCKVSIATPATKPKGGQFVLHAKALHGNPFDGHTLGPVITELEQQTGVETRRIHVDKGYRGHNHKEKFRVWISGQVRGVTKPIRRGCGGEPP